MWLNATLQYTYNWAASLQAHWRITYLKVDFGAYVRSGPNVNSEIEGEVHSESTA